MNTIANIRKKMLKFALKKQDIVLSVLEINYKATSRTICEKACYKIKLKSICKYHCYACAVQI